jgi:hypothetical protein
MLPHEPANLQSGKPIIEPVNPTTTFATPHTIPQIVKSTFAVLRETATMDSCQPGNIGTEIGNIDLVDCACARLQLASKVAVGLFGIFSVSANTEVHLYQVSGGSFSDVLHPEPSAVTAEEAHLVV